MKNINIHEVVVGIDFGLQFGTKCQQYLKEKNYNQGHYFKNIKMHLY